jgi:integrase
MALTDTHIRAAKPKDRPFKLVDGGGLHLEVRPNGSKLWRYRFRIHGKESVYAIGQYPDTSLADARKARDEAKQLVRHGLNPVHHRKLERLKAAHDSEATVEVVAREWVTRQQVEAGWSKSYSDDVTRILERDLFPSLGFLPIKDVKPAHLLRALRAIEQRGALTVAARARYIASEIWRYAIATLRADSDIAASLRGAIQMPVHAHHPSLPLDQIPAFLSALKNYSGRKETAIALRLLLLLFPRPSELVEAPWIEFNLEDAIWRIPAARMKLGRDHIVPIPRQGVQLLRGLRLLTGEQAYVFPHRDDRSRPMTAAALRQALRSLGFSKKLTPHGFRATASTALNEMGFNGDWIEVQLAHLDSNRSRSTYNRALYLENRAVMLQAWADLIDTMSNPHPNVVVGKFQRAA